MPKSRFRTSPARRLVTPKPWLSAEASAKAGRLAPEPKRIAIGLITRKGKLSPATEKFCQCAKDAFASKSGRE